MAAEYSSNDKEPLPLFLNHNLRSILNLGSLNVESWKGFEKLSNYSSDGRNINLVKNFGPVYIE